MPSFTHTLPPNMNISNGLYEITSALSPEFLIGRPIAEDRSLLPKSIVALPRGDDQPPYPWTAVQDENDTFILKAANEPTADIDGKLQAVLTDSPSPTKWKITPVPQQGENAYIVVSAENEGNSWTLDPSISEIQPFQPVLVGPLIVAPSEPPTYPPAAILIFKRVLLG